MASLALIKMSSKELMALIDSNHWEAVLLPRPGCGAGSLLWDDVKLVIEPILDGRVIIVSR
jgi:hypothetical protein